MHFVVKNLLSAIYLEISVTDYWIKGRLQIKEKISGKVFSCREVFLPLTIIPLSLFSPCSSSFLVMRSFFLLPSFHFHFLSCSSQFNFIFALLPSCHFHFLYCFYHSFIFIFFPASAISLLIFLLLFNFQKEERTHKHLFCFLFESAPFTEENNKDVKTSKI